MGNGNYVICKFEGKSDWNGGGFGTNTKTNKIRLKSPSHNME